MTPYRIPETTCPETCPKCGSDNINTFDVDGAASIVFKGVCDHCTFEWREYYDFKNWTPFEED